MAEQDPGAEPDPQDPQAAQPEPTTDPEPEPEPQGDDTDWKAEARKWEKRAKDNSDAAARLKEIEDAQKSEQDKLKDRIAELEPTAHEAARLRVALRKGLTEVQAKRLVGDTVDELEADAEELLASFATNDDEQETPPRRRPRERLRPGAAPASEPEENDPIKLAAQVPRY